MPSPTPANQLVSMALDATDPKYLESCFAQRNPGPKAAGSVFLFTQTVETLKSVPWEAYSHPNVQPPAQAFTADIPGFAGIVKLEDIEMDAPDAIITLLDGHRTAESPRGCGKAMATVRLDRNLYQYGASHTTILIGPDRDEPGKTVVWTFFPGNPINASEFPAEEYHGRNLTIPQAHELGIRYVKIVGQ